MLEEVSPAAVSTTKAAAADGAARSGWLATAENGRVGERRNDDGRHRGGG